MKTIRRIGMLTLTVVLLSLLSAAVRAGAAPPLLQASGGGFFTAQGGGGENHFMFAFNARQLNDDPEAEVNAEGQFEQHNLTNGGMLHLDIYLIQVGDNNTVWLTGLVTKSVGASAEIGECRVVSVRDNGKGASIRDERSKLSSDCEAEVLALIELDHGNIRVR